MKMSKMSMIIDDIEYIATPEIEYSSCFNCVFYRPYRPGDASPWKHCGLNDKVVKTESGYNKFDTKTCATNKIIWMEKIEQITLHVKDEPSANDYGQELPEQTYTESQIIHALENWTSVDVELFMRDLKKFADPEYDEFIRLRQKFGSVI